MTTDHAQDIFVRSSVAVLLFLFVVFTMSSAQAKDMHCNCWSNAKANIDGKSITTSGTTYKMTCKSTWSKLGDDSSSSDYNQYVKIYYSEGTSSDTGVSIKVRPRKNEDCLAVVYDQDKDIRWTGAYCNNEDEKKIDGFKMKLSSGSTYMMGGRADTVKSANQFFGLYTKSTSYMLIGACVEDK